MNNDTLKRDDTGTSETEAFDALDVSMRKALRRAAKGRANLSRALGEGWLMVPTKTGLKQVAYFEKRAWAL